MNMIEEKKRLESLKGTYLKELSSGEYYKIMEVYHNIYKDVCFKLMNMHTHKFRELIEGSEEYCKNFAPYHNKETNSDVCDN